MRHLNVTEISFPLLKAMKVGFHFDADHAGLGLLYGDVVEEDFFNALYLLSGHGLSTNVYVGDLRLNSLATEWEEVEAGRRFTFSEQKYLQVFASWLASAAQSWARFSIENYMRCIGRNIFVVYTDNITPQVANSLNQSFKKLPYYLGALEVNENSALHRVLYPLSSFPRCRVIGKTISIFHEGFVGEDLDLSLVERCQHAGFLDISHEIFNPVAFID